MAVLRKLCGSKFAHKLFIDICANKYGSGPRLCSTQKIVAELDKNGIYKITLNRPEKKNALTYQMYEGWRNALDEASKNPEVTLAVVTGTGDYFCAGNDIDNFQSDGPNFFSRFVTTLIEFPKPLIALVNGPAIGIASTWLGLCDAVYATDKATFFCPFVQLSILPEACSSYTYPMTMGFGKADEMLIFGQKVTAEEACRRGLVTEVFPQSKFEAEVWTLLQQYATYAPNSMNYAKMLMRSFHTPNLHKMNSLENELFRKGQFLQSEEFRKAIGKLKSKKK